jgi:uncharacterized protein YjbI with pentapeptide repeats
VQRKKPDQKVQQAPRHSITLPTWAGLGNKTIWDWVSLLLLPIVLTVGGLIFTGRQEERQQELEDQRAARELHLADQVAQDKALQAYLDQMSELIQAHDLLACENACWETIALAQARTETVMQRLDADHNRSVVRFLNGADLLGKEDLLGDDPSALSLFESADLAEADLENTDLREVVLRESYLREADLNQAHLANADLGGADLTGAHLRNAQLQGTYLDYAELSDAELSDADLSNADLDGANLTGADLSGADLSGADLTDTDLNNADLSDANLQGAYKHDYSGDEENQLIPRAELEQQAKSLKGATMTNEEYRPEERANAQQPGTPAFTDASGNTIEVSDVPPGWTSQISNVKKNEKLTILNRNLDSNVNVLSEPLGSKFDTPRRYAKAQGDLLREQLPEYHELTVEQTNVFGGDRGVRRVFTWDPKHGAPVTQIQQYYAENRRGYVATATALSSEIRRYEDDMQQVLVNMTLIRGVRDRVFEPAFRFEVGQKWEFAAAGTIDQVFIQTGPNGGQLLFTNPHRVFDPSNLSAPKELPAPENTAKWVAWFQRHPNLNTSKLAPESVGNASGKRIDVTLTSTPENYPQDICGEGSPCVPLYLLSEKSSIASYDGWKDRFVIVDVGGETVLINVSAPKDKFDKFLPKAQKVLDSVEWKGG